MLVVDAIETPLRAGAGALCPVLRIGAIEDARAARERGALLLVDTSVASRIEGDWVHPRANWAMAGVLDCADPTLPAARIGAASSVHPTAILYAGE